jgi:hypothetical protein
VQTKSNLSRRVRTTGNPFVDTGLAVLANQVNLAKIRELELRHLFQAHKDGKRLADTNSKLKSFTMFFTTNSLLTQPAIKEREKRIEQYSAVVTAFLKNVGIETIPRRCESCGNEKTLDFETTVNSALESLGVKPQERFVGRDWFPLAGSFGSDAQSLPSASRAPAICALCLFAVQYAPLASILYDGKLALFSSNDEELWYKLVSNFHEAIDQRIQDENYETPGKKEGTAAMIQGFLGVFRDINERKTQGQISPDTVVNIWQFSNAQSQECIIQQIPNKALRFFSSVSRGGWNEEVLRLIRRERRNARMSILQCIIESRDYPPLYPYKQFEGVSPHLFVLYQTEIMRRNPRVLATAFKIADSLAKKYGISFGEFRKVFMAHTKGRASIKGEVVRLVENGSITPSDYFDLFPLAANDSTRTEYWGWDLIKYYMWHHEIGDCEVVSAEAPSSTDTREPIYYASTIYNELVTRFGLDGFEKRVMVRLQGRELGIHWLQLRFQELAKRFAGFTYGDWSRLFVDAEGKTNFFEPLFRMRLIWAHYLARKLLSVTIPVYPSNKPLENIGDTSGIPRWLQASLEEYFEIYVSNAGIQRFDNVLKRINAQEIGLGWVGERLATHAPSFRKEDWERFLADEDASGCSEVRFKISLFLANLYRLRVQG